MGGPLKKFLVTGTLLFFFSDAYCAFPLRKFLQSNRCTVDVFAMCTLLITAIFSRLVNTAACMHWPLNLRLKDFKITQIKPVH
jgi:hypothetical protein